jgi:hypothetical protein
MSENNTDHGHGDSVAAWAAVIVILVAFTAGTFAFWFDQAALVWACAGLAVAGLALGFVLKAAGYGVGGSKSKSNH